ncbi:MAG: type IV pilus biogenesis/stability protein PilW [Pseudomonadota bacterium]
MKKVKQHFFILLLPFLMVTACNQITRPTAEQSIQPTRGTNEVAAANLNLGVAYLKEGRHEEALEKLNRARKADPEYSPIYNVLGLLYQKLEDSKKAEGYFKKALSINSNDSSTLNNYGNFLCQQDRIEEAEQTFLKAASNPLYETPEIAITNIGICLYSKQRKEEAKDYFAQALQLNPQVAPALIKMCEFALDDFNYLSARAYLQRYEAISRHSARSLWLGIQIARELGDKDAVSSYALLLKNSFPDSDEAAILNESEVR